MRRDVNVLIFLDIKKALQGIIIIRSRRTMKFLFKDSIFEVHFFALKFSDGIAFYISENKVILTEGIDGVVPVDYFQKIESWPNRQVIPF